MAAVQDLVRWLKTRRSLRRTRKEKAGGCKTEPNSPQLGSRIGIALPPLPPQANMPDISRDCATSPYNMYEEIPAYAIDTRLDILRETHIDGRQQDQQRPYLVVPLEDRELYALKKEALMRQARWEGAPEAFSQTRVPRQSTPWNHCMDDPDQVSGQSINADQLDRWVSIPESMNYLGLSEQESLRRQTCNSHQVRPWFACDTPPNTQSQREFAQALRQHSRQLHSSMPHVNRTRHASFQERTSHPVQLDRSFSAKEKVETYSDDSGVSSPSLTIRDDHWGPRTHAKAPQKPPPQSKYSDTDSNASFTEPSRVPRHVTRRQHTHLRKPQQRHEPDSSDTYNEYDRSDMDSSRSHNAMSPQEYSYYLSKTKNNMKRSFGVKNFVKGSSPKIDDSLCSDPDSTQESIDLTSVSSLSDFSMYMDEEVAWITSVSCPRADIPQNTSKSAPSEVQSDKQSAFKPYNSQRRHSYSVASTSDERASTLTMCSTQTPRDTPQEMMSDSSSTMTLEDRLSCRVTNLKISDIRRKSSSHVVPVTGQAARRPSSGVPSTSSALPAHNKGLSDIMRINHDRHILGLI